MNTENSKPIIFLNKVKANDKSYIKLFYKSNDIITRRIKDNDWIKYSLTFNAFYTEDNQSYINLLSELFSDIAIVSLKYLQWKELPKISESNIGLNSLDNIDKRSGINSIYLFPFEDNDKKMIGFKKYFPKAELAEINKLGLFRFNKNHNIWQFPSTRICFTNALEYLMNDNFIKINSELKISDIYIKRILLEQVYIKYRYFKSCPIEFLEYMQLHNYSNNTISTYHNMVTRYINSFKGHTISQINNFGVDEIDKYHKLWVQRDSPSPSLINQSVNAIKLYYNVIGKKDINLSEIHRPMRNKSLPNIYSKEEIKKILDKIDNLKHKTIIMVIYSGGLRLRSSKHKS